MVIILYFSVIIPAQLKKELFQLDVIPKKRVIILQNWDIIRYFSDIIPTK